MKKILFLAMLMLGVGVVHAEIAKAGKTDEAVFVWLNGSSTCYRLSEMPVVSYESGAAVLTIRGVEQLRVPAESIGQLTITYGIYQPPTPTSVEPNASADAVVHQVGKYIIGGQLIIVKDGVQYDVHGRLIK